MITEMNMEQFTIGIDVGGTKTAYGVFDEYNHDERPVYFKKAECGENCGILGEAELVDNGVKNRR